MGLIIWLAQLQTITTKNAEENIHRSDGRNKPVAFSGEAGA
jgi:hypothetical protein